MLSNNLLKPNVVIYTDGACKGNPGPGGWGAVLIFDTLDNQKNVIKINGGEKDTTNNRMELLAVVKALEYLQTPHTVTLYSDSAYVCNGINEWVQQWQKNDWRTKSRDLVKNVTYWQAILKAAQPHDLTCLWTKGHSGNTGNDMADKLANQGIAKK